MHTREKFLKWMFNPCTTWFTSKTELVHIQWELLISASRLFGRVFWRWCSDGMQVSILFIWKSENNAHRSFHLWVRNLRCSQDVLWLKMINMRKIMFRFFFPQRGFFVMRKLWNLFFCLRSLTQQDGRFYVAARESARAARAFYFLSIGETFCPSKEGTIKSSQRAN